MISMTWHYLLPCNKCVLHFGSKKFISTLFALVFVLSGGGSDSTLKGAHAASANWWTCLKSAFPKNASYEFNQLARKVNRKEDPALYCSTAKAQLDNLFGAFFNDPDVMKTSESCRQIYGDEQRFANELYFKRLFFNPICDTSRQILFQEEFNFGVHAEIYTKKGFYDALGVTEKMCPEYEQFSSDMMICSNVEAKVSDLKLSTYVENFCLGYYNHRMCYHQTLKTHCKGPWKIGFDRTRVSNFESVCQSAANQIQTTQSLLISLLALTVSYIFSIS